MMDSTKLGKGLADFLERAGLPLSDDQEVVAIGYLAATQAQLAAHAEVVEALIKLRDCDWVITLPNRMDAVREIAREALANLEEAGK